MLQEDAIWLAAVFDCEGTINLTAQRTHRGGGRTTYYGALVVCSTYLPMVQRVSVLMDNCRIELAPPNKLSRKPLFRARATDRRRVRTAPTAILPHLMEKAPLARELLAWLDWSEGVPSAHPEYETRATNVRQLHARAQVT